MNKPIRTLIGAFTMLLTFPCLAETIEMWARAPGDHADKKKQPPKYHAIKIEISTLATEEKTLFDRQYNKRLTFKTIAAHDLIRFYTPIYQGMDLVILHFSNGSLYPLRRDTLGKGGSLYIATAVKMNNKWTNKFPTVTIPRQNGGNEIIAFDQNKVVADEDWLRKNRSETQFDSLDPLSHFTSVVGVEFADSDAYYRQFMSKGDKTEFSGRVVYIRRCQFCHGVGELGARSGPNFASEPLIAHFSAKKIYSHVKQRAAKKGQMPNQPDFTVKEAKDLHRWLTILSKGETMPYEPYYEQFLKKKK